MRLIITVLIVSAVLLTFALPSAFAQGAPLIVVNLKGEVDAGQSTAVHRAVNVAKIQGADTVLLELDTFGGRVDAAVDIRDTITGSGLKTICYIKNRAWSAGALIAISHQEIVIAPGGSIGAAEPIPATEKNIAALRAEFASTAGITARNPRIAEAMVDKTLGFPNIAQPGQIVALTDSQAIMYGYANFIADDRQAVLVHYGLDNKEIIEYTPSWRDKLSGWLADPSVKSLLIAVIILAILTEIKTAGMGVAALIGLIAGVLFFVSQWWGGYAGWPEAVLFVIGIFLLLVELYVPGGGLFGLAGLMAVLFSLFLALGASVSAVTVLASGLGIGVIAFLLVLKKLPTSKLWAKLVLKDAETSSAGYISSTDYKHFYGKEGTAITPLRPSGIAQIEDAQLNVITEGQYIAQGVKIKVVSAEGNRIVVTTCK